MRHLIVCTEYPPAHIPPGGVGMYTYNISRLLAEAGETVHVIGRRWAGAPDPLIESHDGKLIVHRVPIDEVIPGTSEASDPDRARKKLVGLRDSDFSEQVFAWQVALYVEKVVQDESIDVIESQEVNAPLYFFQLRRALGLGPQRQPPCFVHLHTSSEQMVRYNEWDAGNPYWITAKRLEDYSIAAADALLCPSQFLAQQTEGELGLEKGAVTSIPLPIGDTPRLERSHQVWSSGTICYVGRLEPRKGVIEWVDAAISVADDFKDVHFEFIGADLPYTEDQSVQQFISQKIPSRFKKRFHFRGSQSRESLLSFLKKSRIAVVPSRWENFPNTCVEAMCSGLPVIASPNGGMAEMIEDDQTGWIAAQSSSEALAQALRRALNTPPARLADMGGQAEKNIRQICDNNQTVQRHLEFRRSVFQKGAHRSLFLPMNLPHSGKPLFERAPIHRKSHASADGIALIVDATRDINVLSSWIASIGRQLEQPEFLVLLVPPSHGNQIDIEKQKLARNFYVVTGEVPASSAMRNIGIRTILNTGKKPIAFGFLDILDELHPEFLRTCVSVLRHCSDLGIVSTWREDIEQKNGWISNRSLVVYPCPTFPHQLIENEVSSPLVIRTEALTEANLLQGDMDYEFAIWNLINVTLASSWKAATIPELLIKRSTQAPGALPSREMMYRQLLASTPEVVDDHAQRILHLLHARASLNKTLWRRYMGIPIFSPQDILRAPLWQKLRIAGKFIRNPCRGFQFMLYHVNTCFKRVFAKVR